jgi:hypothetical protein
VLQGDVTKTIWRKVEETNRFRQITKTCIQG